MIDSASMQKVIPKPLSEKGPVADVILKLKRPLKYGSREGKLSNKTLSQVRVQIAYDKSMVHAYVSSRRVIRGCVL